MTLRQTHAASPDGARRLIGVAAIAAALVAGACSSPAMPATAPTPTAPSGSPLGPSYVLLPLPSDDQTLLGRVLSATPEPGRALEELSRPNPCADKLGDVRTIPLASTFEDVHELTFAGTVRAMLGTFGFQGDARRATHFIYKLETSRRVSRADTAEYALCCREHDCGYGYVSALVYGEGEYATAEETGASGGANVAVASADGMLHARVLHRRKVHGFVAGLVTVTSTERGIAAGQFGALGAIQAAAGIKETELPETVKQIYEQEKLEITDTRTATDYVIRDGRKAAVTENDFARRYKRVTGSPELDGYDRFRRKGSVVGGAIASAAGIGLVGGALALMLPCRDVPAGREPCATRDNIGIWLIVAADLAVVVGGTYLILGLSEGHGDTNEHLLTEGDARLYVARYNRALLRKVVRETQSVYREAVLEPIPVPRRRNTLRVWPTVFGLAGHF